MQKRPTIEGTPPAVVVEALNEEVSEEAMMPLQKHSSEKQQLFVDRLRTK